MALDFEGRVLNWLLWAELEGLEDWVSILCLYVQIEMLINQGSHRLAECMISQNAWARTVRMSQLVTKSKV